MMTPYKGPRTGPFEYGNGDARMQGSYTGVGLVGLFNTLGVAIFGIVTRRAAVGIGFLLLAMAWGVWLLAQRSKGRQGDTQP